MRNVMVVLFVVLFGVPTFAQEIKHSKTELLDYGTAYGRCQSGDKPMLVLVTATWCAPCQQMKSATLPQLMAKDTFKDFHFAMVDCDAEPEISKALIGDRGVPQLILFQKVDGNWVRRYIAGMQTPEGVEAFIANSQRVQIANSASGAVAEKK